MSTLIPSVLAPVVAALPDAVHSFGSVAKAIVGIGSLIFVHELGHFLACRLTRTRVETFSIGFGPRLFGWETKDGRRRFTVGARREDATTGAMDVRIAAIPLGGYVKMAGEIGGDGSPTSGAGPTRRAPRPDEYPAKSFGARVLIITAGVIMNVLAAITLYGGAYAAGILEVPAVVGEAVPGGQAWKAGLRPGDRIESYDGEPVRSFLDLTQEIVYQAAGSPAELRVRRDGELVTLRLTPAYDAELGMQRAEIAPAYALTIDDGVGPKVVVGATERAVLDGHPVVGGYAAQTLIEAALSEGAASVTLDLPDRAGPDAVTGRVISFSKTRLPPSTSPTYRLGVAGRAPLLVAAVLPGSPAEGAGLRVGDEIVRVDGAPARGRASLAWRKSLASLTVKRGDASVELPVTLATPAQVSAFVAGFAFPSQAPKGRVVVDLRAFDFPDGRSPAGEAGVRDGDLLLAIGDHAIESVADLAGAAKTLRGAPVVVKVETPGQAPRELTVTPKAIFDEKARTGMFTLEAPKERVSVSGLGEAAGIGVTKTVAEVKNMFRLIGGFFGGRISFSKNVGGPLTIANLSSRTANEGWGRFFAFLAFISVNLAVLNILPIPVLDGGQLMFLLIEKARGGRPLSDAAIARFQLVGFGLLMLLMVFALKNDVMNLIVN